MKKQVIFMFSGQGSQYYQMGKELYENQEEFRYWMDHCDQIVSPLIRQSLIDILYRGNGKGEPFDKLVHTNPALLCIQFSMFKYLKSIAIEPDFLLGYSLGEIIAAVVSGGISLEDGIQFVVDIALLAQAHTPEAEMLAIIESKAVMARFPDLFCGCWLTGSNFDNNFVVTGFPGNIRPLQDGLSKRNITSLLLPVKQGFHTGLIDPIEEACKQLGRNIRRLPIGVPIISSLKGKEVHALDEDYLWEVIRQPVDFEQAIHNILEKNDYIFIDLGPSGSLATFVKNTVPAGSASLSLQVMNQFGRDLNAIEKLETFLQKAQYPGSYL